MRDRYVSSYLRLHRRSTSSIETDLFSTTRIHSSTSIEIDLSSDPRDDRLDDLPRGLAPFGRRALHFLHLRVMPRRTLPVPSPIGHCKSVDSFAANEVGTRLSV